MNTRDALDRGNYLGRRIKEAEIWIAEYEGKPRTEEVAEYLAKYNQQYEKHMIELINHRIDLGVSTKEIQEFLGKVDEIHQYVKEQKEVNHDD